MGIPAKLTKNMQDNIINTDINIPDLLGEEYVKESYNFNSYNIVCYHNVSNYRIFSSRAKDKYRHCYSYGR